MRGKLIAERVKNEESMASPVASPSSGYSWIRANK